MKFNFICGLGAVAVLAVTGCNKGGGASDNSPVATVGKAQVTRKEFFDYIQRKGVFVGAAIPQTNNVKLTNTPGFQALQDLIEDKLVEEIAKEQSVFPTETDVNTELAMQLKHDPHLVENLFSIGYSMDEIKTDFRDALCRFNITTKGVTVTKEEVDEFIKANPKQLMEPPKIDAQMIIVKSKADEKNVDDALRSGQPFTTVAQTYSLQKDPKGQFRYPESDESRMSPALRKLFDSTPELKTTEWQPVGKNGGFIKIYVAKKVPEKPIEATDYVRETIKRGLMQQKGARAGINLDKLVAEKIQKDKDAIKIDIKQDEEPWKAFVVQVGQKLAAANDAAAAGAAAPGTPANGVTVPAAPAKK